MFVIVVRFHRAQQRAPHGRAGVPVQGRQQPELLREQPGAHGGRGGRPEQLGVHPGGDAAQVVRRAADQLPVHLAGAQQQGQVPLLLPHGAQRRQPGARHARDPQVYKQSNTPRANTQIE